MRRNPILALSLAVLAGCAQGPSGDPEDGFVVPDGKQDDFLSLSAREYEVEGTSTVTVEEGKGRERAIELIRLKHVAIGWFLNVMLVDDEDEKTLEKSGFGAMVKTGRVEDLEIKQLNARSFSFTFRQLVAGRKNLLKKLPLNARGEFTVEMGKPTNEEMAELVTNHEWYREPPWDPWKPATVPAEKKESLTLSIRPVKGGSSDAWFDHGRLNDDGVLTIDAWFGWDFHDNFHIRHSRDLYGWLTEHGFDSPVASFERYGRSSGPLTTTIEADGKDVEVQVRIFYGKPGSSSDPDTAEGGRQLERDMRDSLNTSDVIIYAGHSGPFFGFALANWKKTLEGDLDDTEMLSVVMPANKYQVVFAEGCDTLMIGPAFLDNKFKKGKNIDVLTSTTFSDAESNPTKNFIGHLIELDSVGRHGPLPITSLLVSLDPLAMYGVHGVDDNPHLHPYADTGALCDSCSTNGDCGGAGNACINIGSDGRHCAAACTNDDGCPDGFTCREVASAGSQTIFASMCVPADLTCE